VRVVSGSHLKCSALRINGYLSSEYDVTSYVKTGAGVKQVVNTMESELQCLSKNDIIILCGGTNDIDNHSIKKKEIALEILNFIRNYSNMNIILVMLPYRLDQAISSRTNLFIKKVNTKLVEFARGHKHVSTIGMSCETNHFTKHGFHMNHLGKEKFAKRITDHTRERVNVIDSDTPIIPLDDKQGASLHLQTQNSLQDNTTLHSADLHINTLTVESHTPNNFVPSYLVSVFGAR
jgi:lysophospholipase L1-like esterase